MVNLANKNSLLLHMDAPRFGNNGETSGFSSSRMNFGERLEQDMV
ncbi:hypothetical protein SLEP1_g36859 [Rubroshorea leprosula]|uniref:Uncharacterized protein n=1 Tax=Rubroshorea leprosula TaxID=152421 RepID=A0AAV5KT15_9ROSI|nr:hypothetical protein SLEP1_g36859 [Rubroshorea leprosula]